MTSGQPPIYVFVENDMLFIGALASVYRFEALGVTRMSAEW